MVMTEPVGLLTDTVYQQLHEIASAKLAGERRDHTLQATALVHEAYLRLAKSGTAVEFGPSFYWPAAEAMRRVLIDHARSRGALKRGSGSVRKGCAFVIGGVCDLQDGASPEDVGVFTDAMDRLIGHDPRAGDVVRLRFFAGLSVAQVADVLGITERMVKRDWEYARVWLAREMQVDSMAGGDAR